MIQTKPLGVSNLKSNKNYFSLVRNIGLVGIFSSVILAGCASNNDKTAPVLDSGASFVFKNGTIYTVDTNNPHAEAVVVTNENIVFVGSNLEAKKYIGKNTQVVDLNGKLMLPGFHDVHMHPDEIGSALTSYCNLIGVWETNAVETKIKECAIGKKPDEWVMGTGFVLESFNEKNYADMLNTAVGGRPAYLYSQDGHQAWVSTKGLEIIGIDENTPNPSAGEIVRIKGTNTPSGILSESAMFLANNFIPEITREDIKNGRIAALKEANKHGITSIGDAWNLDKDQDDIYSEMEKEGALTARVNLNLFLGKDWDENIEKLKSRKKTGSEMVRANQIKLLIDGVLETGTAALKLPYKGTDKTGDLYFTKEQLNKWVPLLESEGFQLHAHTVGDAAVSQVLDALEVSRTVNGKNNRPHFAHNYLIDSQDYDRLKAADATLDFTMLWRQANESMQYIIKPSISQNQYDRIMPMADVEEQGLVVTGASDWPVSDVNPLASIMVAITGEEHPLFPTLDWSDNQPIMPGKKVSLKTMIEAYTINGAYASKMESFTGSIEANKRADLIVLNQNIFEMPEYEVHNAKVSMTMLNGKIVHGSLK